MTGEFTIELKSLCFFSFHGLYEEERKVGGEFVVDLSAKYAPEKNTFLANIDETVNYATLYKIVQEEMSQPRNLLETIAQSIAEKIHQAFPLVDEVEVSIEKKNPPVMNFTGSVGVRFKKLF